MTEREMLERIARFIDSGEMEADMARMETALAETVWMIGLDPEDDVDVLDKLRSAFIFEDVAGDRRPVRLAQAIALGAGRDIRPQTCGCTHELCPDDELT